MEGIAKLIMGDVANIHAPFTTIPATVIQIPQIHSQYTGTLHYPYQLIAPRKPVKS